MEVFGELYPLNREQLHRSLQREPPYAEARRTTYRPYMQIVKIGPRPPVFAHLTLLPNPPKSCMLYTGPDTSLKVSFHVGASVPLSNNSFLGVPDSASQMA